MSRHVKAVLAASALLAALCVIAVPARAKPTYITFDVPGATYTCANAMNASNVVAGTWSNYGCVSGDPANGYVRAADGTITTFNPPNSQWTEVWSINDGGVIAGDFTDGNQWHGYVRTTDGTITVFDVPGGAETFGYSINKKGSIAGSYSDAKLIGHGYVRSPGGKIKTFDVPPGEYGTYPYGINSMNVMAGTWFTCQYYCSNGFVRASDGAITTFNPVASDYTLVNTINSKNVIAGSYGDSSGTSHGFLRNPDASFTLFDFPGAPIAAGVPGLNTKGDAVGYYVDTNNFNHGFLRLRNGAFKTIDMKNATYTQATAINDNRVIAGSYIDATGEHGFLRMPQ